MTTVASSGERVVRRWKKNCKKIVKSGGLSALAPVPGAGAGNRPNAPRGVRLAEWIVVCAEGAHGVLMEASTSGYSFRDAMTQNRNAKRTCLMIVFFAAARMACAQASYIDGAGTTKEKIFLLAQSYMPAQEIQILESTENVNPWYRLPGGGGELVTPEWIFPPGSLKRF